MEQRPSSTGGCPGNNARAATITTKLTTAFAAAEASTGNGEYLQREPHLLYILRLTENQMRCSVYDLCEHVEDGQAAKQHEREIETPFVFQTPPGLENDSEHEREDGQQEHRRQKRPQDSQISATIAARELTFRKLDEEVSMDPQIAR